MAEDVNVVQRFYDAFSRRDAAAMAACYTPDVRFDDEVFSLQGAEVGAMWAMLCASGKDMKLTVSNVRADGTRGSAHWDASYTFSGTGRKVLNRIDAEMQLRDGLIAVHRDRFDFWAWSRQALGLPGWLLGWSPMLRAKVRAGARQRLTDYIARQGFKTRG